MTHPPFDPEPGAALAAVAERIPPSLTPADIQTQRERMAEVRLAPDAVLSGAAREARIAWVARLLKSTDGPNGER